MLSANDIKYIRSLQQKKFRQKYNNFIAEGDKIAKEMLLDPQIEVEGLYALQGWLEQNHALLKSSAVVSTSLSPKELGRISGLRAPNQVLVIARQIAYPISQPAPANDWALYLEHIQDPGNFGTILRIADWFGIPYVFCSAHCVELYNPKVIQASMGAFLRVRILYESFEQSCSRMKGLPLCGTSLEGENLFETRRPEKGLLVIGNESKGISATITKQLDHNWQIPNHRHSKADSLNVAVATGIICALLRSE